MPAKKPSNQEEGILTSPNPEQIKTLVDTALGKIKADMVIANADLVNVYSGELLKGHSVAIKGEKIAYVGENAEHTTGPDTMVIDASGKTLIPGLINSHAHITSYYTVYEFLKYAMRGGTTSIITEITALIYALGHGGVKQFQESVSGQPVKIFITAPPLLSMSPAAKLGAPQPEVLQKLLKQKDVLGLGETDWTYVLQGDERVLRLFAQTLNSGKTLEGHSAGARGNKLEAYIASGISSCHESVTAEDALERLRLGIHTMIREGDTRHDLETIAEIKDEKIDFRRLVLVTDGESPRLLTEYGYMEFLVQKAIDLGFDPIVAIQMATLNAAEHFSIDHLIGGIAPGKFADMVLIPDLRTIKAEMVISNGKITARNGEILVPPRKHVYPKSVLNSVHLPGKLKPDDFHIHTEGGATPVTVRVIHQVAELLTREELVTMTPKDGLLKENIEEDILKAAVIERTSDPGKMFVGFVKGFKMTRGAFASSCTWALSGIVVVGTNDEDMAGAVNRIKELQGGIVVYAGGKVQAELPLPVAGVASDLPVEVTYQKLKDIQQKATGLGTWLPDLHLTSTALTTCSVPFIRMCESGLMHIKEGKIVGLIV